MLGKRIRAKLHGLFEIMRDQVCSDFCIRCSTEYVTECAQMLAQRRIVLDHAIVHENDFAVATRMRMRVQVARLSMRRPACVSDPGRPLDRILFAKFRQLSHSACFLANSDPVARLQRNPGAVVTPVFESKKSFDQVIKCLFGANVSDDPAHEWRLRRNERVQSAKMSICRRQSFGQITNPISRRLQGLLKFTM